MSIENVVSSLVEYYHKKVALIINNEPSVIEYFHRVNFL